MACSWVVLHTTLTTSRRSYKKWAVLEILERNCSSVFLPLPKTDVLKSHVEKKKVTGIAGRDYLSPHD
ncbi:hypothetical protein Tco_0636674, partial [Tanacetum coccineum]